MSINTRFEGYKLQRELKRSGKDFLFQRKPLNDLGEPVDDGLVEINSIRGIYHQIESRPILELSDETTLTRSRFKKSMLLCSYPDVISTGLKIGDVFQFNDKTFIVNSVVDIQEWGIIADISLELVDYGVQVSL